MGSSEKRVDFGFAFNDKDLSDRVLHLHITPKDTESTKQSESVYISTPIVAANSPFFYKLFKNETKDSTQKDTTLMINSTEEMGALIDVLGFMYKKTLKATTSFELLAVLGVAHKFEVPSCVEYCIKALLELPISVELAVLCIDLPPSIIIDEVVHPLIDASKEVLAIEFMDLNKSEEEAMELPLSAIKFVLTTDGLRVNSEDDVFDFILKWTRAHYPNLKERQETLTRQLWPLVHFQYMSCLKLKEVLAWVDIEHEHVSKLVSDALMAKMESPYGKHLHPSKGDSLARRAYRILLVKVVLLDFSLPHCIVYLNLRRDDCENLSTSKQINSQSFLLGGQSFYLMVQRMEKERTFGLFIVGQSNIDFEFAVMKESSNNFITKCTKKKVQLGESGLGDKNLLGISWDKFMSNGNNYFINDILHLRAKIILNNSN